MARKAATATPESTAIELAPAVIAESRQALATVNAQVTDLATQLGYEGTSMSKSSQRPTASTSCAASMRRTSSINALRAASRSASRSCRRAVMSSSARAMASCAGLFMLFSLDWFVSLEGYPGDTAQPQFQTGICLEPPKGGRF